MTQDRDMLAVAAALARRPYDSVAELGRAMLAHVPGDLFAGRSSTGNRLGASASLNPEGIPIELAITASGERLKFRLVVDPAAMNGDPVERYRRGRVALDKALALSGTEPLRGTFIDLLEAMLPDDPARLRAYGSGPFCMAAALGEPGVAIYIDAKTHEEDAYARAGRWLTQRMPDPRPALSALESMSRHGHLAAVGLEGTAPERALAKLYWRLDAPRSLSELGLETFAHPDFRKFLSLAMGEKAVPASGLMLAAGYRLDDGSLHDAKINLCGHCLDHGKERWPEVVNNCTDAFALQPIPANEVLQRPGYDVSFLTFGLTCHGDRRVNCYLRPTARQ